MNTNDMDKLAVAFRGNAALDDEGLLKALRADPTNQELFDLANTRGTPRWP